MTARLFVAIWPDARARAELAQHLKPVRAEHDDVRWQSPERWHITLAFLGPTDPDKASTRLTQLVDRKPLPESEPLRLRGSGTFNTVIWAGVEHGPWLAELAGVFRAAHIDDTPFRAHLTVGRIRGPQAAQRARAVAHRLAGIDGPPWTPRRFLLVASFGGPQPEYRVLRGWPLPAHP